MDDHLKTNPELGERIRIQLQHKRLDHKLTAEGRNEDTKDYIANQFGEIMTELGLDLTDPSLVNTPKRVARMFCEELFVGLDYNNFPDCTLFPSHSDELVVIENIEVNSVCEHHFVPFIGTATVGYIPRGKILGISKFNRVVDFFSRRPQVQERLTSQISEALQLVLETDDIAVVIRAEHMCARIRGVKAAKSTTRTSALTGRFRSIPELRSEFLSLMGPANG